VNPFVIEGPAVISFSGGRTSAYMLAKILETSRMLDEPDWRLPPDVHVLFANTGKERPETLDFIHECEMRWNVPVVWLEYHQWGEYGTSGGFEVTNYAGASRQGDPFDELIWKRKRLPNPIMRFCTQELKIRPMRDYMRSLGYDHWTNVVGLRADEPRRVANMRAADQKRSERWDIALPLADAGLTLADVDAFWREQPFDLRLKPHEGNCDLCFLKALGKKRQIVRDHPGLAVWWMEKERQIGQPFRDDQPDYAALLAQPDLFKEHEESLIDCYCTD
jgi:3'-phosphoadenosine 5'-phosphosulfate sulfotransferase (PAPS reductase)/FAD synthetase